MYQLQYASRAIDNLAKLSTLLRRREEVRLRSGRSLAELVNETIIGLQEVYPKQAATAAPAAHKVRRGHRQRARRWQKRATKAAASHTEQTESKFNKRLTAIWCVRSGLSDPKHSLRSVASYLADFAEEAGQLPISKTSVARLRDGFAETIIRLNRREVSELLHIWYCV